MQTQKVDKGGFTLIEIMIVVAIIALLAAVAIPNFIRSRTTSQQTVCINNLRKIDDAKQQWALETLQGPTALPTTTDIQPYIGRATEGGLASVYCPSDGASPASILTSYDILRVDAAVTCRVSMAETGGAVHSLSN